MPRSSGKIVHQACQPTAATTISVTSSIGRELPAETATELVGDVPESLRVDFAMAGAGQRDVAGQHDHRGVRVDVVARREDRRARALAFGLLGVDGSVGQGVADYTRWLRRHPLLRVTTPRPVSIGGLHGVVMDISKAPGTKGKGCTFGENTGAVAFIVGEAAGLDVVRASTDYIHMYRGDREALMTAMASRLHWAGIGEKVLIPMVLSPLLGLGLGYFAMVAALSVSSTVVDCSPLSTNGALVLANSVDVDRDVFFRRLLVRGGAVVAIVYFCVQGYLADSLSFTFVGLDEPGTMFDDIAFTTESFTETSAALGFKVNPVGKLLVDFNLLFALNDSGLRDDVTSLLGIEYFF